jgi:hypothetical protein
MPERKISVFNKYIVSLFVSCMMIFSGVVILISPSIGADFVETEFENNTNVTANLTTIAPNAVAAGDTYAGMLNITFHNTGGINDTLNFINVTVLNYTNVQNVTIWNETNGDGNFSTGGDSLMGSSGVKLLGGNLGYANISGLNMGFYNDTYMFVYVVFNISSSANNGDMINASILANNMNMTFAGTGGFVSLYPVYNTIIDTLAPTILTITTTDPDSDGYVENATIEFSEPINDASIDFTLFKMEGVSFSSYSTLGVPNDNKIELSLASGIVRTDVKDVTYTFSTGKNTDLVGNELASFGSSSITELDGASPVITSAVTGDGNGNGYIDEYELTFSENITVYSDFYKELSVAGYSINTENSFQSSPNMVTIALIEGIDFDTGATPDITYPSGKSALVDTAEPLPIDIASGDLNNDTYHDVVMLNSRSETISVYLHDGIVGFRSRNDYASGISKGNITVGDVTSDGLNDVIATNYDTGDVLVFAQNASTNSLDPYVNYSSGNGALGVAIGDVNDDERNDVVVANFEDDQIAVFKQTVSGTLGTPVKYTAGDGPTDVVVADFTRTESYSNVLYDVVVTNYNANTITPYRQTTANVLTKLSDLASGTGPLGISAGDLNGDGWTDIAVANSGADTVSVFRQYASSWTNTYLSTSYRNDYSVDIRPTDIVVFDANNDGRNDIVSTNRGNNSVAFMTQSTTGTISFGWKKTLDNSPNGVSVGDFDLNGSFDAVTSQPDGNVFTIINQEEGDFDFDNRQDIYLGSSVRDYNPRAVDIADINNDGINDIVVASYTASRISVYYGNPAGGYRDRMDYSIFDTNWYEASDLKIGDLNNDGLNDVAVTLYNDDRLAVFYQNTSGILNDPVFNTTGSNPRRLAIGDLNNDGLNDVAVTNRNSYTLSVFIQNSITGLLNQKKDYSTGLIYPWGVAIGDVNSDSKNDVVVTHDYSSQTYHMSRFTQRIDGTLNSAETFQYMNSNGMYFYDVEIADLDSDGKNDIVAGRRNTNQFGVWYQNIAKTFGLASLYSTTYSQPYDFEVADINYDGKTDLLFTSYNSYYVQIWGQSPTSALQNWASYRTDTNPHGIAVDDVNSDGLMDIVTANYYGSSDGSITIYTQNPTTYEYDFTALNSTIDYPYQMAKGDVNNDGLIDIAVVNQNSPYYLGIHLQTSSGLFSSATTYSAFSYSLSVAIGDVNNDTRNDVVIGGYGWIAVYTQKTDGTLNSYTYYSSYREAHEIAIGDVNNDTLNDVVVAGRYRMMVFTQNIGGTLNGYTSYLPTSLSYPHGVAIGDFNNDTLPDVVLGDSNNDRVLVYLQQSTGGLTTSYSIYTAGDRPIEIVANDFNNDGLTDFAVSNNYANTISVFTQKSTGGFNSKNDYASNTRPWGIDTVDFDGDGLADIITGDYNSYTISLFYQKTNGLMDTKQSYDVYTQPQDVVVDDFDDDNLYEIVTTHPNYDYIHTLNPVRRIGTSSNTEDYKLGVNSLDQVFSADIAESDGANPIFAQTLTGNQTMGNSSSYTSITVRFSEDLNETTLSVGDFTVAGKSISVVNEVSPGNVVLNVSALNSSDTPLVSLIGSVLDANGLSVPTDSKTSLDGLRPRAVSAVTTDNDLNGQIESYVMTFDETIYGTFNGLGFNVTGYPIDFVNTTQTGPNEITIRLYEKSSYDTGLLPEITYIPGFVMDASGNFLKNVSALIESDGAPPALAGVYVTEIFENHPNLYAPNATMLYYNNSAVGLDATFTIRLDATDNGRLGYAVGENAFGNTSVMDTTENSGGSSWEYELNYTINTNEFKLGGIGVTVFDIDNNNATDSISVVLDITPPVTSLFKDLAGKYVAPFTPIYLIPSDTTGIYRTKYRVDSGAWTNYTGLFTLGVYGEGQHYVDYYSIDMVNNTEGIKTEPLYVTKDWTGGVPAFGNYSDIVILGCNLTINDTLVFENVTLIINTTSLAYPQWINVTNTGKFVVRNSTILSISAGLPSRFIVSGELDMLNTNVSDLWADSVTGIGGLEIYNDSVYIKDSRIYDAANSAVYIDGASPTITGTTISDSVYGIVSESGGLQIANNTISDVTTGIVIMNNTGDVRINNITFTNLDVGLSAENVFWIDREFEITDSSFKYIANRAVDIDGSYQALTPISIHNNTFQDVKGGIRVKNINGSPVEIKDNVFINITGTNVGINSIDNNITYIMDNIFTNTRNNVILVRGNEETVVIRGNDVNGGSGTINQNVIGVYQNDGMVYIDNNMISNMNNIPGIGIWSNDNNTNIYIRQNQITDNNQEGIRYNEYADDIFIENNVIDGNRFSIIGEHMTFDLNDYARITNNDVTNSTSTGISIKKTNDILVEDNYLYRNGGRGIEFISTVWGTPMINSNLIMENTGNGMYLASSSINLGTSVKNNTFIKNDNGGYGLYTSFNPGAWNVYDKTVFVDNKMYFGGGYPNIVVKSGGNLSSSSTKFDYTNDITIEQGGMIFAYDTIFSGISNYDFNVFGDIYLSSCTVEYSDEMLIQNPGIITMIATTFQYNYKNGIHLNNANITLSKLRFYNNYGNGLFIEDSSPLITDNEFVYNDQHGIYTENFNGNITANDLAYNEKDNIRLKDSEGMIYYNLLLYGYDNNLHLIRSNTTIKKNAIWYAYDYGIYLDHSDAHILLNKNDFIYYSSNWGSYSGYIRGSDRDGVYIYYSNPHIENNTIWGNDKSGVSLIYSGGHIEYNEIAWNLANGIGRFNEKNPSIHDNYLHDNGDSPPNRAPSATGGTISPSNPIYSSTLSITPVGWYDPDGDPAGFLYQWQKNASGTWTNIAGAIGATLTGGIFGGDEIRCRLTPWDGKTTGPIVNSSTIIIGNSPPSIISVSISPTPSYDNSALTAVPAGFSDPDGDTSQSYYYTWFNDSGQIPGATSSTLPPSKFKANDTIYTKVIPSDGQDNGTQVTSSSVFIVHYVAPGKGVDDYDGDGVPDSQDAFPYDKNEWRDTDNDGKGDNSDPDIDGDGVNNTLDKFPYDKSETKDNDNDGIGDNSDQDDDNDGYIDAQDAFPFNSSEWRDTDNDNIGDNSDTDIDGDGVNNTMDAFPYDKSETKDFDSDGVGDNTDQDDDDDGYYDLLDAFPLNASEHLDTDKDLIGDNTDTDDDNDGYLDDWEGQLGSDNKSHVSKPLDTDSDGKPDGDSSNSKNWMDIDDDGDGFNDTDEIANNTDPKDPESYPGMPNRPPSITKVSLSPTPTYDNSILTAVPEGFSDPDGDTTQVYYYKWYVNNVLITNVTTSYLTPSNFKANDTVYCMVTPSDGEDNGTAIQSMLVLIIHYTEPSDKPKDYDGDGVIDSQDAFPYDKNEWHDTDNDGTGDNSDTDIDGDGVLNGNDKFKYDKTEWDDTDNDGIGDNSDNDIDGDGVLNSQDAFPYDDSESKDNDNDGIGDNTDNDIDGDGTINDDDDFPFNKFETKDTDSDGIGDNTDQDDDDDGYYDVNDDFPLDPSESMDTDSDGVGDNADPDDDNDGFLDDWEGLLGTDNKSHASKPLDTDGDGQPDGDSTNSESWMDTDDDNDGYSDTEEKTAGTNPLDPLSYPGAPNRPPAITKATISPATAYENSVLTAVAEGFSDPDGDTTQEYYYQWYVNDVLLSGEVTAILKPDNFKANDTVYCIITPSDSEDNGIPVKSNILFILQATTTTNEPSDYDGDGTPDTLDDFPTDPNEQRDTDGDGTGDNADDDIDGDGIDNENDKFPSDKSEWEDKDDDGQGDRTDPDDDNDGYPDDRDDFPNDPDEWKDTDGDGLGDNSDSDLDGDGMDNDLDEFPRDRSEWLDSDNDGLGDNSDPDDDNDGHYDIDDAFRFDASQWKDTDGDGRGDNPAGTTPDPDIDGDGVLNNDDLFPTDKDEWEDTDDDGIGNNRDPDDDGDGVVDIKDDYPLDKSKSEKPKETETDVTEKEAGDEGVGIDPGLLTLIIVLIIIMLIMAVMYMKMNKQFNIGETERVEVTPERRHRPGSEQPKNRGRGPNRSSGNNTKRKSVKSNNNNLAGSGRRPTAKHTIKKKPNKRGNGR